MAPQPKFSDQALERICRVLGEEMSGTEMTPMLARINAPDPDQSMTKWRRLLAALQAQQSRHGVGNHVIQFIHIAMDPVRFIGKPEKFDAARHELNMILAFCGYTLGDDGKLRPAIAVATLSEAEKRAGRLRSELQRRGVHPDVLIGCRAELVAENYFHAVLEATKSLAAKVRAKSALNSDGHALVDEAFGKSGGKLPLLAFNTLVTDTERSEHLGFMNLMKGIFSAFRNPTAHEPRVSWAVTEEDALDVLCTLSLLHRRLDKVVLTRRSDG